MSKSLEVLKSKLLKKENDGNGFLRVVIRKQSDFIKGTLKLVEINDSGSINAIIGVVKAKTIQLDVQAIRFLKKDFTIEQAQEWTANNYKINKIFKF